MTETLFERYKEALRAGHVAVLRGRLEDAVSAYRDAISISGDRAVPWAALGGVRLRMGDPEAALAAYDAALAIAPEDGPSLLGRAQALVVLRRTPEAAATYDRLADLRVAGDRPADAAEAARRALDIEPTDPRRSRHASLVEALGRVAGHAAAGGAAADAGAATDLLPADAAPDGELAPEPEPMAPAPDPEELVLAAEEAAAAGDVEAVAAAALAAARAYRAASHDAAAFEACLRGIEARPADVDLHLLIAELAVERGWRGHAGDAYHNLVRLAELDGDAARAAEIRALATTVLPDDRRFAPA